MAGKITTLARNLRKTPTRTESLLWRHLRLKQVQGFKFRRQAQVDNYIVDFICFERRLVIEVDGGQHAEAKTDKQRDSWFQENGFRVLRFWNNEVLNNIEGVMDVIREELLHSPSPQSPPVKGGDV